MKSRGCSTFSRCKTMRLMTRITTAAAMGMMVPQEAPTFLAPPRADSAAVAKRMYSTAAARAAMVMIPVDQRTFSAFAARAARRMMTIQTRAAMRVPLGFTVTVPPAMVLPVINSRPEMV